MLTWIREKFGTVLIGGIIAFISFVFVFYGVFTPKATRGLGEGAVAGTVNGDAITISEFNREYSRRAEYFKQMLGGKISDEQLKAFRLKEGVFQELARRKLMVQEAERQGLVASDEEVKEQILKIPAFQKDGKFDLATYKQVLEANNYSAGGFERLVREDISAQQWNEYFRRRVHVAPEELKGEFGVQENKRNIKYVLLTAQLPAPDPKAKPQDVEKARQAAQKTNDDLANLVVDLLKSEKSSDAKVNAVIKGAKVKAEVKTTGLISQSSRSIPSLGEAEPLLRDAFAKKSPIDPAQGGKAKKYVLPAGTVVAVVSESKQPDFSKLPTERTQLIEQLTARKQRELMEDWMKKLTTKSKIDPNPSVVGESS